MGTVLQSALWRYTVWNDAPTPGGQLQNLRYARSDGGSVKPEALHRFQKVGFLIINVLLPWLAIRLGELAQSLESGVGQDGEHVLRRWPRSVSRWCLRSLAPRLATLHAVCNALSFLVFLRHGTFYTLGDRMLGIRLVHINPAAHRQVAFEFMNRVMIWNGLSEFLITVTPLVNLGRLRQTLTRRFFPKAALRAMEADAEYSCGICGTSPMTLPMRTDCGHVFCYFCIASEQMDHPGNVTCPSCKSR